MSNERRTEASQDAAKKALLSRGFCLAGTKPIVKWLAPLESPSMRERERFDCSGGLAGFRPAVRWPGDVGGKA
ncbi:protein of unknown function (plasmid) [Cupriavidus neocaledonicus]|uniref:Uncharacterized protein n=1 Tax=Cupriavidus neocaledonicus TaxID=1040979 RepID=A0A375HR84_9BURK|nr:protein of unknown function [Cupriavidus neocaledonicus]